MSEQKNLTLDDLLADGALDLGGDESDFDPFAQADDAPAKVVADKTPEQPQENATTSNVTQLATAEDSPQEDAEGQDADTGSDPVDQPETSTPPLAVKAPAAPSNVTAPDFNPLAAAVSKAEEENIKAGAAGVLAKPPVFIYGAAKEDITDNSQTFEQLRIAKSEDFPELDDQKRVTWTMEYGTIVKQVPKPKETVIHALKEEIETSKEFLEMLKKQKGKKAELVCKVKPRITAQSKGIVSAYKGVFVNMEEADASGKPIRIMPAKDGQVYEIRCTEAGRFVVPLSDVPELPEVSAGFFPALPRIPFSLICQVIGFFRHFMGERELEAMVHIYWDRQLEEYRIAVPKQQVGRASVEAQIDIEDALDDERYVCFADIHSHNSMPAKFSLTDDHDERMTRVYLVIGRLDRYFPEISARISCGGRFLPIPIGQVIEDIPGDFPSHWTQTVNAGEIRLREEADGYEIP